jgi:nucleotide-binding universal stress UspA family protein
MTYRTILVPLDGSPASDQAPPHAKEFARRFEAEVVLLRAVPTNSPPGVASPSATSCTNCKRPPRGT